MVCDSNPHVIERKVGVAPLESICDNVNAVTSA
jgi:hypothetical protein